LETEFGNSERRKDFRKRNFLTKQTFTEPIFGMIKRAEKNITLTNIEKIAKALDVDIKKLF
jgi:hypothetical protein